MLYNSAQDDVVMFSMVNGLWWHANCPPPPHKPLRFNPLSPVLLLLGKCLDIFTFISPDMYKLCLLEADVEQKSFLIYLFYFFLYCHFRTYGTIALMFILSHLKLFRFLVLYTLLTQLYISYHIFEICVLVLSIYIERLDMPIGSGMEYVGTQITCRSIPSIHASEK